MTVLCKAIKAFKHSIESHDVVETYNELWLTYFGDFFLTTPFHTVQNLQFLSKNSTIEKNCIEMNMIFKTEFDHNFERKFEFTSRNLIFICSISGPNMNFWTKIGLLGYCERDKI